MPDQFISYVGHKEGIEYVPQNIKILAYSDKCIAQMIKIKNNIYATQFHPELDHASLIKRINIYKNHGYFKPNETEKLIKNAKNQNVKYPHLILKNFIDAYLSN